MAGDAAFSLGDVQRCAPDLQLRTDMTDYRDLLPTIEPRTINSDAQAETYRDAIDVLTSRPGMSDDQREMVGLLAQHVYD